MIDLDSREPRPSTGPRPGLAALLVVTAYLLLGLAWLFSNPPGAAPDEQDHLVKSLANASGQIGVPAERSAANAAVVPTWTGSNIDQDNKLLARYNSTTRTVTIPNRLNPPAGYPCFAFQPLTTASCLPPTAHDVRGSGQRATPVGAYPPFFYVPLGLAAHAADTVPQAFYAARLIVLLTSSLLLWIAFSHLIRWLGRRAVLGLVVLLTPTAVFLSGSISPGSIELASAAVVSSVVAVALHQPSSLSHYRTQVVFTIGATCLVLSRQLGVIAFFGLLTITVIALAGRNPSAHLVLWRPRTISLGLIIAASVVATTWWEATYDRPASLASPVDAAGLKAVPHALAFTARSGVGRFGWADTPLPAWALLGWMLMAAAVLLAAFLCADRREKLILSLATVGAASLTIFTYVGAFYPIGSQVQGRHVLPLFALTFILAGTILTRKLMANDGREVRVGLTILSLLVGAVHLTALYVNGRRYAVGTDGPWLWLSQSEWSPPLGWAPWLALGLVATGLLAAGIVNLRPRDEDALLPP